MMNRCLLIVVLFVTSLGFATEPAGKSNALIAALKQATKSPNPHVRAAAARALGDMGAGEAREQLIDLLQDKDNVVSSAAAESLARTGDQTTSTALIAVLARDVDIPSATNDTPVIKDTVSVLEHFRQMKEEERSVIAIRALSRMKDPKAGPVIIDRGLNSPQLGVRIAAAIALGRLKEKLAAPPLIAILEAYYQAGHTDTGPVFDSQTTTADDRQKIKESNAYLRSAVAWALGEIGDPLAKPVLKKATEDDNSIVRDTAKEALEKL